MGKNRWAWFKRTLFGYKVVFVSVDYEHIVKHRPFRHPVMKTTRLTKWFPEGKAYEMMVFDESTDVPLEAYQAVDFGFSDKVRPNTEPKRKLGKAAPTVKEKK